MSFNFDTSIIYPQDPTASAERINQYKDYYKIKHDICKEVNPSTIAEIGVRAGYSSWTFMQACPSAKLYCIDANNGTHGGRGGEDGEYKAWAKKILSNYDFEYIDCDTQKEQSLNLKDIDFFHVDGDHTVGGVMHDLDLAINCISKKGAILIDDIEYIEDVKIGVKSWLQKNKLKHKYIKSLRGECLIYNEPLL
jgi:hypothetical protein